MCVFKKKLKVGQVWQKKEKDPFKREQGDIERAKIVEIRKRYVKYLWRTRFTETSHNSSTISLFRYMFGEFVSDDKQEGKQND